MSLLVLLLSLALQETPERLAYPDALLADDPLAPLPEAGPPAVPTCNTRAFSTEIEIIGPPRRTAPVLLCANTMNPDDYDTMLRSARQTIGRNADFTAESRADAMAAIDAELDRIEGDDTAEDTPVGR